jgi:hypothetical protein
VAFRVDNVTLLRSPRRTADGALRVDATLARTGVQVYHDAKGNAFREYRPPSEVFDPESMASFEAVPVTDDHPEVMVDAMNVVQYKRGRAGDTVRKADDGRHLVGSLIVEDAVLQAKMANGKRQVSNGYTCDLDMTPGVSPDGEAYDAIQRNIRGNHIAIVDAGRAGSARVRMDGAAYQVLETPADMLPASDNQTDAATAARKDAAMNLEQALAALHAANEKHGATKEQLANETKRADSAEQAAKDAKAAQAKAEAESKTAQAKADAAADEVKSAKEQAAKAKTDAAESAKAVTKARVQLIATALKHKVEVKRDGKDVDVYDASDVELRLGVISKLGAEVPADKRDNTAYVEARYDFAVANDTKSGQAFDALAVVVNAPARTDAPAQNPADDAEIKARRKMNEDSRNEWHAPEVK